MNTTHNRYHIGCSCCGLAGTEMKKNDAIAAMIRHMNWHAEPDPLELSVYDSMNKNGPQVVYSGRLDKGIRSHWSGVKSIMVPNLG